MIPDKWPRHFATEEDAIQLVECLIAEGRVFHFDDEPDQLNLFTQGELIVLARFEQFCDQFCPAGKKGHGIWWLLGKYPCTEHRLGIGLTRPIVPPGWHVAYTGGGCTALRRDVINTGLEWLITDIGSPSAPTRAGDACRLGLFSESEGHILQWHCSCLAEAVQIAEGAQP